MTKITGTAFARRFEVFDKGKVVLRRATGAIESFPGQAKDCPVCGKPMRMSLGQVMNSHRECRTKKRKAKLRYGL